MDRMSDSGSDDGGSNPFGNTLIFKRPCKLDTYEGLLFLLSIVLSIKYSIVGLNSM